MTSVLPGLARLLVDEASRKQIAGRTIGLVAHPASVLPGTYVHARRVMADVGANVRVLFGPEHGYGGEAQDMIGVQAARDRDGVTPIHSLYGGAYADLTPRAEWLHDLDAVVIDLQDVGARYYTFVWTAVLVARACSALGVETIVLDRPNPLGGLAIEGSPQDTALCSFVGLVPTPVRHGLTVGEIVRDVAQREGLQGVSVVEMQGWRRSMSFAETQLPWVLPSPNMPTVDTAVVYPGGCLLEGTHLSEGRGTTRPFEIFGAPWVDGPALAEALARDGGAGFVARPLTFFPMFQKHARALCGGVQIHVTDALTFQPYRAYLAALRTLRAHERFAWRSERYEFVDDKPAIDLLTGDARVRIGIDRGESVDTLLAYGDDRMKTWGDPRDRWRYPT